MLTIKNKKDLNKFKKEIGNNIIYEFDEDVVIDFKQLNMIKKYDKVKDEKLKNCKTNYEKVMLVMEEKYRPHIIYKGKSMTFNYDVDWIDELMLEGDLICKGKIQGYSFHTEGNIDAKKIICESLICSNLMGSYASIEYLVCNRDIDCEMLKIGHIISCGKLKAKAMTINGTMLYNVSAVGENFEDFELKAK